jgi:hypothetical protein
MKWLVYLKRGRNCIKTKKTALEAVKRLKTISGRLLRELQRKLLPEKLTEYERKLKHLLLDFIRRASAGQSSQITLEMNF